MGRGYSTYNNFVNNSCSGSSTTNTSNLGFMPNNPGQVNAGETFLVGKVRHDNYPIYSNGSYLHGSIYVEVNGTYDNFSFYQYDTPNNSKPALLN